MKAINIEMKRKPVLDPEFMPANLWNREYVKSVEADGRGERLTIALERGNGTVSVRDLKVFPHEGEFAALNIKYVERMIKYLLWMKGGRKITIAGNSAIADAIRKIYSPDGGRAFDYLFMGEKIYGKKMEIISCDLDKAPEQKEMHVAMGRNFDGCRIGFDLGGSDRKCAAVIDGEVVFSEEIRWNPYFEKNPGYHRDGIDKSLKMAASKLPQVDAIGGSAAGVYVDNKVRAASLFRGVSDDDFKKYVVNMFLDIQKEWGVPMVVVNDGEVTALAGSIEMNDDALLGISMGTSLAAGYVNADGNITDWLNELAFAPIDYRDNAPADEWSGDLGCGVQYFSQQGVARLASPAGIELSEEMPFAERLIEVQNLMAKGDRRARDIYETIGVYFAHAIANYADYYDIRNLLILGRVTSGEGGNLILSMASDVLKDEFPEIGEKISFCTPDEKNKRHGQAVAAASLPAIG
jgi:predicted NBD/HSP70 family sugar kinase